MVTRVVPEHSKSAVGRASKLVGKGRGTPEELAAAREVLSNFRSACSGGTARSSLALPAS